jgi:hypothetical protein
VSRKRLEASARARKHFGAEIRRERSRQMRAYFLAMTLAVGAALSGCASVDEAMFGTAAPAAEPATTPAPESNTEGGDNGEAAAAPAPAEDTQAAPAAETAAALPPAEGETAPAAEAAPATETAQQPLAGTLPSAAPPPSAAPRAASGGIGVAAGANAITIQPGVGTGTSVNQTIAGIRASLQDINNRMAGAGAQLASIRASSAQQLTSYHQMEAQISAHLQIGTTRANPELVSQWNGAQASLDQLTSNINALNSLVSQINGASSNARGLLGQIQATFDVPGAVDEDHRQLTVLEDETNQIIVVLDRLGRDASADLRRETASLASERASLADLQAAIKNGGFGGAAAPMRPSRTVAAASPAVSMGSGAGSPVVTIRFARANVDYQKSLYQALSQALSSQPNASFDVIGVSPTRSSAAAVQTAQATARRHAQAVMHTMTEMGVPAARMNLSSSTDPGVSASEVRVFVR